MKNVVHAFGALASPLELSAALTQLRIAHIVVDNSLMARPYVVDIGLQQPAWPVILPSLKALRRFDLPHQRQILYVCGSTAELEATNLRVIKDWKATLIQSLKYAVLHEFQPTWELQVKEMAIEDYVEIATKPSFLGDVQTAIYKITPYDLRKAVQAQFIAYLAGIGGFQALRTKLSSSYKLEVLRSLLADPRCAVLRNAVTWAKKTGDVENVAVQTGVEKYEIMYLLRSTAKKAI